MNRAVGVPRARALVAGLLISVATIGVGAVGVGVAQNAAPVAAKLELSGGPLAMRRLTEDQYRNSIKDIFGDVSLGGRFEPDTRANHLIAVGASKATVTPGGLEQYDRMGMGIAQQVVSPERRDEYIPCKPADAKAADDACARAFLSKVGALLYRRPLTNQEINNQVMIARDGATKGNDFYYGLQLGLAGLLQSPKFLFVHESAEADPARPGAQRLSSDSIATRLSLFLWGSAPDQELLRAAASGELYTQEGLGKQVDRMITSPRFEAGVRAYFADMLQFDLFRAVSKDADLYPNYSVEVAGQAQEQALRTIVNQVVKGDGDYRKIFTTDKTFMTPLLAAAYNVPFDSKWGAANTWEPVSWPANMPQAGVVTQIGFAALHSSSGKTSPTLRGKAVREQFMCQDVPPPPPDVDFSKFAAADITKISVREAIEAHAKNPACAGCHRLMDGLGLALENYNTAGMYRTLDAGKPIDASGSLDGVAYKDAAGLGKALHDSPRVAACVATRVFDYAAGRGATAAERQWVTNQLIPEWSAGGYKFPQLMRRIALDPGFYKVVQAGTVVAAAGN